MTRHFYAGTLALLLGAAACGGEDLVIPSEGEPAKIALVQGDGQSGRVGEALPQPLIFAVTDLTGRPVPDALVVTALPGAELTPDTAMTGDDGRATVGVVLGPAVGSAAGNAKVVTPENQQPVEVGFTVAAVAASANGLVIVSGQDQVAAANTALAQPLVVQVTDAFGNPIAGVPITWTPEGGGAVSETSTVTDAGGTTSVTRTLGPGAGLQRTLATGPEGLAGSPAAFLHTATAGSASGVVVAGGDGQRAAPGTRLPQDLAVRVTDADGNPVVNAAVTWVVTGGGGTMDPSTSTTDGDGRASTRWTLGPQLGTNTAQAVVSGVGTATFTATAVAGAASSIEIVSGSGQSAQAGQPLPASLVVRVRDGSGNPVAGASVLWQVASGGGTVAPSTNATDAAGQAAAAWTLGGAAGPNTLTASVAGAGNVTFTATATVGAPAALSLQVQPSTSAEAGVPFGRQPVVQLKDAGGNDVAQSGVAVTAAIASGGGSLGGTVTRSTDGDGRAAFTDLEINGATGAHSLIFAASGFTSATSGSIDVGPAPTATSITSDAPDPSVAGEAVTVQFTVTSPGGTPSGTVVVTTSGGAETCSADAQAGSCALTLGTPGSHTLTATYSATSLFAASSGSESHQVAPPNSPPVANPDGFTTAAGQALGVAAPGVLGNDTDPDGDPLQASVVTDPTSGTLALAADGGFVYTPNPLFTGTDVFTYRAADGRGGESIGTVTITVQ